MIVNFEVINDKITQTRAHLNKKITADSKNYLIADFNFRTEEWIGKPVWALFTYKGKTYKRLLGEDGLPFNQCHIPNQVVKTPFFTVCVYCGDRVVTNAYKVELEPSGYTEEIVNDAEVTTTVEQMDSLMMRYAKICNSILLDCQKILKECQEIKSEKQEENE